MAKPQDRRDSRKPKVENQQPKVPTSTPVRKVTIDTKTCVQQKVPANFYYGTGRRKCSIAKVWLFQGTGNIVVNDLSLMDYYKRDILVKEVVKPLAKLDVQHKYDIKISTLGGGLSGQAIAAQLGISRALLSITEEFKKPLREENLLTRDSRIKERKKYGKKRARKGYQYRKR